MARTWFSRFKDERFDISDTPHSGRPSGFNEDRLNRLIHNDPSQSTRELPNVMNCDHSTIVRHFTFNEIGYKIGCMGTARPKSKPQKSASGHNYVHLCLLVIDWIVNNVDHSYPVSLLVTRNGVFMLT